MINLPHFHLLFKWIRTYFSFFLLLLATLHTFMAVNLILLVLYRKEGTAEKMGLMGDLSRPLNSHSVSW